MLTAAENLRKAGFKEGDAILIFVSMSYELYVTILAVFYTAMIATVVFLDAWSNKKRFKRLMRLNKAKGFVGNNSG